MAETNRPGYFPLRSEDERNFVRKHLTFLNQDRNENGDDVFKATNIQPVDREQTRLGYNPGNDEGVYDNRVSVNDFVRMGYSSPDDETGYEGKIVKIDGDTVYLASTTEKAPNGLPKVFVGNLSNVRKLEEAVDDYDQDPHTDDESNDQSKAEYQGPEPIMFNGHEIKLAVRPLDEPEGRVTHTEATPDIAARLGIPLIAGKDYGPTIHLSVTNPQTGTTTYHSVYQREWPHHRPTATVSVRPRGASARHPDSETHNNVLAALIGGHEPSNNVHESFEYHDSSSETARYGVPTITSDGKVHGDFDDRDITHNHLDYIGNGESDHNEIDDRNQFFDTLASTIRRRRAMGTNDATDDTMSDSSVTIRNTPRPDAFKPSDVMGPPEQKASVSKDDVIAKALERFAPQQSKSIGDDEAFAMNIEKLTPSFRERLTQAFDSSPISQRNEMLRNSSTPEGLNSMVEKLIFGRM